MSSSWRWKLCVVNESRKTEVEGQEANRSSQKWHSIADRFREQKGTNYPRRPCLVQAKKPKRKGQTQNKKQSDDNIQQLLSRHSTKEDSTGAAP